MDVASKAFANSENYDDARKGYTLESAKLFLSKLEPVEKHKEIDGNNSKTKTILELGAGTGQFTKALLEAIEGFEFKIIPSEPLESMGNVFKKNFPALELICCKGDKIPLPDCSIDAVVAANTVHYLSSVESLAEIGRVLVPGGVLAFVCNYVNLQEAPWAQTMYDLSDKFYQRVGIKCFVDKNGIKSGWQENILNTGLFEEVHKEFTVHSDSITEEDTVKMFMSYGSFQHCNDKEREEIRKTCQKLLSDNFSGVGKRMEQLPMKSYLYWTKKKNTI